MKKILFSVLLCFSMLTANAQQTLNLLTGEYTDGIENTIPTRDIEEVDDGIIVTYTFHKAIIQPDPLYPGASFVKINGFGLNPKVGKPSTLFRQDTFVVPEGNVVRVRIIDSLFVDYPIILAPARPYKLDDDTINVVRPISSYSGFYPTNIISNIKHGKSNGINMLKIPIYPIKYKFSDSTMRFFTKIKYKIEYDGSLLLKKEKKFKTPSEENILSNIALNYSSQKASRSESTLAHELHDITEDYVIITTPEFEQPANRLAAWKRIIGYNTRVEVSTSWTPDSIRYHIKHPGANYILLFGDHPSIPGEMKNYYYDNHTIIQYYTDFCYSRINDFHIPVQMLGRASVSTLDEANTVVNKIINYERYPTADSTFYKTGAVCAFFEDSLLRTDVFGAPDGYEDKRYVLTCEEIRNCLMHNHGKNVNRIYYAFNDVNPNRWNNGCYSYGDYITYDLYKPQFAWNGDSTDIINQINSGVFFILHRDHGRDNGWEHPLFNTRNTESLRNGNKLPVVFSINCNSGNYASWNGPCLAEALLRKQNGGCIATFASTQESYSGFNDAFALGLFDAIFPDSMLMPNFPNFQNTYTLRSPEYKLGHVMRIGLEKMDEVYGVEEFDNTRRYTHEIYHLFGDPSMEIYTDTPTPFETPPTVIRGVDTLKVIVNSTEKTKLTFYNKTTGDIASFDEKEVDYVYSQFGQNTDSIVVCVTAHNKIPFIDGLSEDIYIQNEDVYGPITYKGNKIRVGTSVTNTKPTGPVTFESGKVSIIGRDVEIHGETTIPLGTEFEIKTY